MTAVEMTKKAAAKLIGAASEQAAEETRLVAEIADLRRREADAVEAALREGKQTRGPGTAAEGLRRKREAAERKLVDLTEFELPAARRVASEAAKALKAAKLAQAQMAARSFDAFEATAVQQLAGAFEAFLRAYAVLAEAAGNREAVYEQLESGELLNGLSEAERWQLHRAFMSTVAPFPVSPAAMFEAMLPAVLDVHAGNPAYAEHLKQTLPIASLFVELLADVRNEQVYCRRHLRLTETRSATADYSSRTGDRAGGAARLGR